MSISPDTPVENYEGVTYDEVARALPRDIRLAIAEAIPCHGGSEHLWDDERGWFTRQPDFDKSFFPLRECVRCGVIRRNPDYRRESSSRTGRGTSTPEIGDTMNLGDFLLARITEDETVAKAAPSQRWRVGSMPPAGHWASREVRPNVQTEPALGHSNIVVEVPIGGGACEGVEPHIARWDPARVLAECEAKRRIVAEHGPETEDVGWLRTETYCRRCRYDSGLDRDVFPCPTLRLLALPYAEHPDYRPEWRP